MWLTTSCMMKVALLSWIAARLLADHNMVCMAHLSSSSIGLAYALFMLGQGFLMPLLGSICGLCEAPLVVLQLPLLLHQALHRLKAGIVVAE